MSNICVTWLIIRCDMTHSSIFSVRLVLRCDAVCCSVAQCCNVLQQHFTLQRDALIGVTWLIHARTVCSHSEHLVPPLIRVTWLIGTCNMTHWYVCHDSLVRATWLIDTCDMTHWYVQHDSLIRVSWLIGTCDMTYWYVWRDSFIHSLLSRSAFVSWHTYTVCWIVCWIHSLLSRSAFVSLIDTCVMTHWCVWHDSLIHSLLSRSAFVSASGPFFHTPSPPRRGVLTQNLFRAC